MWKFICWIVLLALPVAGRCQSPDSWVRKNDVGFNEIDGPSPQKHELGFVIGSTAYVGLGDFSQRDFWKYDTISRHWTRLASYPGNARMRATAFTAGGKGYYCGGFYFTPRVYCRDLWEYDPAADSWTQKADIPFVPRTDAVSFGIGSKGYLGTGLDSVGNYLNDFWEYDAQTDGWVQKASGQGKRASATGFSLNSKGYIGTGYAGSSTYLNDFWEYDPLSNNWTRKADFGGLPRSMASSFVIDSKAFIGMGVGTAWYSDIWAYDPATDSWQQSTSLPAPGKSQCNGFAIGNSGYIVGGTDRCGIYSTDSWVYNSITQHWSLTENFGGSPRENAVGFAINGKAYITLGTGILVCHFQDVEEFNPADGKWSRKNDCPAIADARPTAFTINQKAYVFVGNSSSGSWANELWQYDPQLDSWTRKANLPGLSRTNPVGFSIGQKGYIGTGVNSSPLAPQVFLNDFWEYDPVADSWTQKANIPAIGRSSAVGFSVIDKGYIATGTASSNNYLNDVWQYDPTTDQWTQKASFPLGGRGYAVGFGMNNRGYIGGGTPSNGDFWEYNTQLDTWTQKASMAKSGNAVVMAVAGKGYMGLPGMYLKPDFWEYTPSSVTVPVRFVDLTAVNNAASITLEWKVAEELDIQAYTVERSADGVHFSGTAQLTPAAVAGTAIYRWTDRQPYAGHNYYRIKAIGKDGLLQQSKTVIINNGNNREEAMVYPNPVTGKQIIVQVSAFNAGITVFRLYTAEGKMVHSSTMQQPAGYSQHQIFLGTAITNGIYLLSVTINQHPLQPVKVFVQNQ